MGPSSINDKNKVGKASFSTLTSAGNDAAGTKRPSEKTLRRINPLQDEKSPYVLADNRTAETTAEPQGSGYINEDSIQFDQPPTKSKSERKAEKDRQLLSRDRWTAREGHGLTYAGLFLFTFILYFRPYELIPGMSGLTSTAFIAAIVTLLIYIPAQLGTEGSITALPIEVKCVQFIAFWALITIPIARDPGLAWETLNEHLSKVAIIFVVMVNIVRTPTRMKGLMWLAIGVGVMLSYQAIDLYRAGVFKVEAYRVGIDFGGMFGNPNDMATHFVTFMPIAVALGVATKNKISKALYFACAAFMVGGLLVTQSRGGILGLLAAALVLAWKIGRGQRTKVLLVSALVLAFVLVLAPGNLSVRVLSIFIPALDPVGSSEQRRELLTQSIIVTLRNPLGIGIGNFPVVGSRNLVTHNAYTQVSSELGWLAFAAYLAFLISPLRKLSALQRQTYEKQEHTWIYYVSIGVYAGIVGYMVSSFFASVAFNWYVYYPVAFAICLRRIYQIEEAERTPSNPTIVATGYRPALEGA